MTAGITRSGWSWTRPRARLCAGSNTCERARGDIHLSGWPRRYFACEIRVSRVRVARAIRVSRVRVARAIRVSRVRVAREIRVSPVRVVACACGACNSHVAYATPTGHVLMERAVRFFPYASLVDLCISRIRAFRYYPWMAVARFNLYVQSFKLLLGPEIV